MDSSARRLAKAIGPTGLQVVSFVASEARSRQFPLYAVGGLPRDLVLGRPSRDFDLVVEGDAILIAGALVRAHGGHAVTHRRFGTATWRLDPAWLRSLEPDGPSDDAHSPIVSLDLITARSETYAHPGQLPLVHPATIEDDLRRRDFTINALAIRLDGEHFGTLLDPLGALDDLRRGVVRVLHDRSFSDDPTRILRAVRYEKRLGFRISDRTEALLRAGVPGIDLVSGKRLRRELDHILLEDTADVVLGRLGRLGVLRQIHPALPHDARSLRQLGSRVALGQEGRAGGPMPLDLKQRWIIWMMHLTPAHVQSLSERLALERQVNEAITAAARLRAGLSVWSHWRPSRLARKLDGMPVESIEVVAACTPAGRTRTLLTRYLECWRGLRCRSTGRDLQALGLTPGRQYALILERLRDAWIDGKVTNAHEERALLESLARGQRSVRAKPRARR